MKLSIVIPIGDMAGGKGYNERLVSLLFSVITFYSQHKDAEIIVVAQNVELKIPGARVINVSYPVFNKSWLINIGVAASKAKYVCIAESDMWADRPYLINAIDWLEKHRIKWAFAWNQLFYTNPQEKNLIIESCLNPLERPAAVVRPTYGYSEGGLLLYRKDFYNAIGGSNEWLEELGGIDNELARRAQYISGTYSTFPKTVHHLWHEKIRQRNAPTRLKNVDIYIYVKANPADTIRVLNKYPRGQLSGPICNSISFYQARTSK